VQQQLIILKADPDAVWMLQGWLFSSLATFWTNDAVKAFIGNVSNSDIIILDLFSESQPQWQRTSSYYGKPFIWCQLHDYGANQGLYGQFQNITTSAISALKNASNLIGFGNSMEGQEGNEIM
jgi:alpha-N-acetylglucosaminidase